jgi:hypothetical protein
LQLTMLKPAGRTFVDLAVEAHPPPMHFHIGVSLCCQPGTLGQWTIRAQRTGAACLFNTLLISASAAEGADAAASMSYRGVEARSSNEVLPIDRTTRQGTTHRRA